MFRHELCAEDIDENRIAEDATVSTRLGGFEGLGFSGSAATHIMAYCSLLPIESSFT